MKGSLRAENRLQQIRKLTEVSRAITYAVSLDELFQLTVDRAADLLAIEADVLALAAQPGGRGRRKIGRLPGVPDNFFVVCGDRHWQYYSIDPSGVEEFSTGAIIDENSRMGRAPGDPSGNDPKRLIKQPYTSKEPSGGFLKVTVRPGPANPTAFFGFYDEHGVELYSVKKEATATGS